MSEAKSVDEKISYIKRVLGLYLNNKWDGSRWNLKYEALYELTDLMIAAFKFIGSENEPREPLDAKLIKYEWNDAPADLFVEFSKRFDTEQEAIAFCAKHGLRIKGESNEQSDTD